MNATSPSLNQPSRTEAEAQADTEHREHTNSLNALFNWLLFEPDACAVLHKEDRDRFTFALRYALEQLHKAQAKRLLERTKGK